jgi:hypothetical protein
MNDKPERGVTLISMAHEMVLHQLDSGEYAWVCLLCPGWGYGALQESAALTEMADHVSLYCEER